MIPTTITNKKVRPNYRIRYGGDGWDGTVNCQTAEVAFAAVEDCKHKCAYGAPVEFVIALNLNTGKRFYLWEADLLEDYSI